MQLRVMTAADIPAAMRLKAAANWNQLEGDWRRQLALEPTGCFVAERNEGVIGTACACVFGEVAWINMVLVDPAHRGQGIGAALMRHVLRYLDERGVPTIRLDATNLGEHLYRKLGFEGDFTLHRFEGSLPFPTQIIDACVQPLDRTHLPDVFELDYDITRTRRQELLRLVHQAAPGRMRQVRSAGRLDGFLLCREGANATQLGPILGTPDACASLISATARSLFGTHVFLDVPRDNSTASDFLRAQGLTAQRSFLRMTRGRRIEENLEMFWASFGPEKG